MWHPFREQAGDFPHGAFARVWELHTLKRGGKNVEYQGRKKLKTTNSLYLTDRGLPLAMSEPVAGNHNGLYDIEVRFEFVTATLEEVEIPVGGLFLNADVGLDSMNFRKS